MFVLSSLAVLPSKFKPSILLLMLILAGCGSDSLTPEQQVKKVMQQMEAEIESRNTSALFEHVSQNYQDHKGNDRDALRRFVQIYMLRDQSVTLLTTVQSVDVIDDTTVAVEATVVMGAKQNAGNALLPQLSADKRSLSAVFQQEPDAWRLISLSWDYQGAY